MNARRNYLNDQSPVVRTASIRENLTGRVHHTHLNVLLMIVETDKNRYLGHVRCSLDGDTLLLENTNLSPRGATDFSSPPEHGEESTMLADEILRCAQDDIIVGF